MFAYVFSGVLFLFLCGGVLFYFLLVFFISVSWNGDDGFVINGVLPGF